MGLKQSIVVKNEFTCRTADGGTRGASPGSYIIDYMSRGGATEVLTPVRRHDHQNYILNYMLREEAAEKAASVPEMKRDFYELSGLGGKAFGYGEISLSDAGLRKAAADVEQHFKSGKTVLKTVISFEEGYLRETGIIRPDFHLQFPGDYYGNIDQLKLRMAVMNGLHKVARSYDDLQYVGVIQVDTAHVHCHLAMFDRGSGILMPDGTQRGKMTDRCMRDLRRGVDTYLEEKQSVMQMTSVIQYHKQNTVGYVKRFIHQAIRDRGLAQFMIACLPEDRNLWHAGADVPEMRKSHEVVREYVHRLLSMPESGYRDAMQQVYDHAGRTYGADGYSRMRIMEKQDGIIRNSMDVVYDALRLIPEEDCPVRTPLLDVMGLSYEDAADYAGTHTENAVAEFGFRLRSYKNRLDHHAAEFRKYHRNRVSYEEQMESPEEADRPTKASRAMYEYYLMEEEYHEMLMDKYLHFLNFIPPDDAGFSGLEELHAQEGRMRDLQYMIADTGMLRFSADGAEAYGQRVYHRSGGQYVVTDPDRLQDELGELKREYDRMRDDCRMNLATRGYLLSENDTAVRGSRYLFDDVKALDLHHMQYDFPEDLVIPGDQSDRFVEVADRRLEVYRKAVAYLTASGQEERIDSLSGTDIDVQQAFASQFRKTGSLQTARREIPHLPKQAGTIRLDYDFYTHREETIREEIKSVIENTVLSLQYE